MADERPDPLAPPEGYGASPGQRAGQAALLDVCAQASKNEHCDSEVTEVWWIGCERGKHVGPVEYCAN
jgi:hypothetical protein